MDGRRGPGRSRACGESGFTLIEVVISLLLLSIVSAASIGLFIRSMAAGDVQAQRQKAIELANLQMEQVRGLPVGSLEQGRTKSEVDALWAAAPSGANTAQSKELWDPTAVVGSVDTVPTVATQLLDGVSYQVQTFVDECYLTVAGVCDSTPITGAQPLRRVAVAVNWTPGGGRKCGSATGDCSYVTTSLLDPSSDPTFNSN